VILLTGASGSIGTLLLELLCKSPRTHKIYAAIRGPRCLEKLKAAFMARGLDWVSVIDSGKVEVFDYNMEDAKLGLDHQTFTRLSQEVTTVIHNAWKLDFISRVEDYEETYLKGINCT